MSELGHDPIWEMYGDQAMTDHEYLWWIWSGGFLIADPNFSSPSAGQRRTPVWIDEALDETEVQSVR